MASKPNRSIVERMFARKSIAQVQRETANSELKRSLGKWNLLLLGVGCIIGAGIFVRTGSAAALHAGPAVLLSFVVAGIVCAFAGLCYAELSSTLPVSGSAYTYGYTTLGEFVAWTMGVLLLLEYGIAAAVVAVGWGGYVVSLLADFGVVIPPQLTGPTGYTLMRDGVPVLVDGQTVTTIFNLPAFAICIALSLLLILGVSESAKVNNIIVAIKVSVLAAFIVVGGLIVLGNLPELIATNWTPFIPENTGDGEFGVDGIMRAASIVFFAYIGFEAVSTAGQEAKDPAKDMPFGIIGSLVVCTVIYMLVAAIMTLLVPYNTLNVPDPVAVVVDAFGPQWGWLAKIIKIGAIIGLTSVVLVLMYGQTRIFYTMARDGLLPHVFSKVHPKYQTPWINTLLVGLITALAAGFLDINLLGDATSVGTLAAFAIVCLSVIYLRRAAPDLPRGFKVPFYPVLPILGIASCGYLITTVPGHVLLLFLGYLAFGMVIYFFYGMHFSNLQTGRDQDEGPDMGEFPGPVVDD
ncbi:amino acid permease [Erythrobacter sp. BLCC-B19]|uniref:amino acid permease n=1 Tax=Erythrobacter sp. BLCC-B19 TaxID=3025315 RepID=UPI0023604C8B|nr:amino acid permease [Erythrobacter sp. BLCC-B19]WDA40794.1 amino acid permease [Erythrobacter sp. BLCC-B19]